MSKFKEYMEKMKGPYIGPDEEQRECPSCSSISIGHKEDKDFRCKSCGTHLDKSNKIRKGVKDE